MDPMVKQVRDKAVRVLAYFAEREPNTTFLESIAVLMYAIGTVHEAMEDEAERLSARVIITSMLLDLEKNEALRKSPRRNGDQT